MKTSGGCLCGKVRFSVDEDVSELGACHCSMCRRWCGGPGFASHPHGEPSIVGEEHLTWYASSEWAECGFCRHCGSNLFYRLKGETPQYAIFGGAFDDQSRLTLGVQIFIEEKPDYYDFAGNIPAMTGEEVFALFANENVGDESERGKP